MLLSLIICIYNGEKYLSSLIENVEENIKSIYNQTELIIVNDGSKDSSGLIVKDYSNLYSNIVYIYQENKGIAYARKTGLEAAKGKYVSFIDQDDIIINNYEPYIVECEGNCADMLVSLPKEGDRLQSLDDASNQIDIFLYGPYVNKKCAIKLLMGNEFVMNTSETSYPIIPPSIWNCIFNREFLIKNHIYPKTFVDFEDDWIFVIESLTSAECMIYTKTSYYYWVHNNESESHSNKYIQDFYGKRIRLERWIDQISANIGVDSEIVNEFKYTKYNKNTVYFGFLNECWGPDFTYKKCIEKMKQYKSIDYKNLGEKKEKILLYLIKNNYLRIAIFLNRNILKKHYH